MQLKLLGSVQVIWEDGTPPRFRSQRTAALLGYLVAEKRPFSRDHLAAFFWPDEDPAKGKANLRRELHNLAQILPGCWQTDRLQVRFVATAVTSIDIDTILQHEKAQEWQAAATLLRGEFLEGVYLDDNLEFESWLIVEREHWRRCAIRVLDRVIALLREQGEAEQALGHASRLVKLDPLREASWRQLMLLYAITGQYNRALRQYERCRQLLDHELSIKPTAETTTLAAKIRKQRDKRLITNREDLSLRPPEQTILLNKMSRFWVSGIMEEAFNVLPSLELEWQHVPNVAIHAWQDILPPPSGPQAATLLEEFELSERALLILGEPGAGKTVSLISITDELIATAHDNAEASLPILLNLASWAVHGGALEEWVVAELTLRYQIPSSLSRTWLDDYAFTLLLDGLDEVNTHQRAHCVEAINRFRRTHGLIGVIICCRTRAYKNLPNRLRLQKAIEIQPLAPQAIARQSTPSLNNLLKNNGELRQLVKTPLMLRILHDIVDTVPVKVLDTNTSPVDQVLGIYVAHLFERPSMVSNTQKSQLDGRLRWLAHNMTKHGQSHFLIEQLQPSWLSGIWTCRVYMLLSRLMGSLLIGLLISLITYGNRLLPPTIPINTLDNLAAWLARVTPLSTDGFGPLLATILLLSLTNGLLLGLLDTAICERRSRLGQSYRFGKREIWTQVSINFLALLLYDSLIMAQFDVAGIVIINVVMQMMFYSLLFDYLTTVNTYSTEVRTVESLGWSWKGAGLGTLIGLAVGLIVVAAGVPQLSVLGLIPFLVGGLQRNRVDATFRPNQGMFLSARNSLIGLATFALLLGIPFTMITKFSVTLSIAICGLIGWIVTGGGELMKHALLRSCLWYNDTMPLRYIHFLDMAVEHTLLRRVGGGYMFQHNLLQTYFATATKRSTKLDNSRRA